MPYHNQQTKLIAHYINPTVDLVLSKRIEAFAVQSYSVRELVEKVKRDIYQNIPINTQSGLYHSLLMHALEEVDWATVLDPIWRKFNQPNSI